MANLTTKQRSAVWREKIQASMLINRLGQHALGECEMTMSQIKAAEILLRKCLPDLKAIEHSGEVSGNLVVTAITRTIIDPANNKELNKL